MRLFRRTLLCLVVGVTAFGAAGWGLRPRPNWTVELDHDSRELMEPFAGEIDGAGVIWVLGHRLDGPDFQIDGDSRRQASAECRDPFTGRLLMRIAECTGDRFAPRSADEFLSWLPLKSGRTRFRVFRRDSPTAIVSFCLDGDWTATSDGKRAWSAGNSVEGWCISRVELVRGAIPIRQVIRTKWSPGDFEYAVSNDGRQLAILNDDRGERAPRTIDLYDLETGTCRRRIAASPDVVSKGGPGASYLRFDSPRQILTFRWDAADGDMSLWELNPNTGTCQNLFDIPPPVPPPGLVFERAPRRSGDAWFALEKGSKRDWVSLSAGPQRPDWVPIPFEIDRGTWAAYRFIPHSRMPRVPGCDAFVMAAFEQSLSRSVPERIRGMLPKSWLGDEEVVSARCYDRDTKRWLEVGRPRERWTGQVRRDALVTLSNDWKSNPILQSWPLPPRDPKPPALVIAALCMAGTWWVCAWRYRRLLTRNREFTANRTRLEFGESK